MEELLSSKHPKHEIYSIFRRTISEDVLKQNFIDFIEDFDELAHNKYRVKYFFQYISSKKIEQNSKLFLIELGFYLYFLLLQICYNLKYNRDINYEKLQDLRPAIIIEKAYMGTQIKSSTFAGLLKIYIILLLSSYAAVVRKLFTDDIYILYIYI